MKSTTNKPPPQPKMYETENDISQNRRVEISALMNQRLADAVDLQLQLKQAHWNVKGPHFIGLHELFDQIDEAVEGYVDLSPSASCNSEALPRAPCGYQRNGLALKSTRSTSPMAR